MTEIDTSKEEINLWTSEIRDEEHGDNWPFFPGLSDFIEALDAERDAAVERAEKAEVERSRIAECFRKRTEELNAVTRHSIKLVDERDTLRARVAALEDILKQFISEGECYCLDAGEEQQRGLVEPCAWCRAKAYLSAIQKHALTKTDGE